MQADPAVQVKDFINNMLANQKLYNSYKSFYI